MLIVLSQIEQTRQHLSPDHLKYNFVTKIPYHYTLAQIDQMRQHLFPQLLSLSLH